MSSTNGSGRPAGSVSIPVEIIRDPNSNGSRSHSRQNSPYRPAYTDNSHVGFSDSPPWSTNSTSRFQPRHSPNTAYERLINNSQLNQPLNDYSSYQQYPDSQYRSSQPRMFEGSPSQLRRSNDDLLSTPFDSMHFNTPQSQFTSMIPPTFGSGFASDSDFVQPIRFPSHNDRRSFDALNDFPDMHQSFPSTRQYQSEQQQPPPQQQQQYQQPQQQQQQQQQQHPQYRSTYQTQHQPQFQQPPTYGNQPYNNPNIVYTDEYGMPTDHFQPNTFQGSSNNMARDRSHSPAAKRGPSPARPPPNAPQPPQPQEEPELKMANETDGPIPMPAPASSSSTSASSAPPPATESQVPPSDTGATTKAATPPPEPARDPNSIALEKLEKIKQTLDILEKDVNAFTGSTRQERAYKMLDEQALKLMMRCDELVDISADIKAKRKEMIRNVQRVITKLESKVPATPAVGQNSNPLQTAIALDNQSSSTGNEEKTENQTRSSSSPQKDTIPTATEQSITT